MFSACVDALLNQKNSMETPKTRLIVHALHRHRSLLSLENAFFLLFWLRVVLLTLTEIKW